MSLTDIADAIDNSAASRDPLIVALTEVMEDLVVATNGNKDAILLLVEPFLHR